MKDRLRYIILFAVLLIIEILIGKFATGFVRGFVGDVLVIPAIYFFLRATFFCKDKIFSVYVMPLICYFLGWKAEYLQLIDITGILGIDKSSLMGILIGGSFDLKDILAYLIGLYLIGGALALEKQPDRAWWYPLGTFIQWTWGIYQTTGGLIVYLWYIRCPHSFYKGTIRTVWNKHYGMSIGQFIFTPQEDTDEETTVHEYGHTFQSLLLGPLYIPLIAIPSLIWLFSPVFIKMRRDKEIRYTSLYCEKWASDWGEKMTGRKALRT